MPFELHYTQADLATLTGWSVRTILRRIHDGAFGLEVLKVDQTYLVPESGVELFREKHRLFAAPQERQAPARVFPEVHPICARGRGELRRKCAERGIAGKFEVVHTSGGQCAA
jgi:hypothetical protein